MQRRLAPLLAATVILIGACGDDDDETVATTTTTSIATTTSVTSTTTTTVDGDAPSLAQSCTNPESGYSLRYPDDWHTNTGDVVPTCRLFDAEPVDVEPATEPNVPVIADVEPVAFDRVAEPSRGEELVSSQESTIDGQRAVRLETRATEEAPLSEAGALMTRWVVEVDDERTFIASAAARGDVGYEEAVEVLDAMMETLELTAGAP